MVYNFKRIGFLSLALLGMAVTLNGCIGLNEKTGLYANPVKAAPATENFSLYSGALSCQATKALGTGQLPPRLAVGRIADLTGKYDIDTGTKIGEGATLYALTALGRAGFRVVERYDTSVSDMELAYAKSKLITDDPQVMQDNENTYRKILAGQISGSDYYIIGGITELNYNLRSSGYDIAAGDAAVTGVKGNLSGRNYVLNIALDLRLVDTRTQEVIDIASFQKQLVGYEIKAGVFDFTGGNIFDLSGGMSKMEPLHLAVRSLVERSVLEFSETLYGLPSAPCLTYASKNPNAPKPVYAFSQSPQAQSQSHYAPISVNRPLGTPLVAQGHASSHAPNPDYRATQSQDVSSNGVRSQWTPVASKYAQQTSQITKKPLTQKEYAKVLKAIDPENTSLKSYRSIDYQDKIRRAIHPQTQQKQTSQDDIVLP